MATISNVSQEDRIDEIVLSIRKLAHSDKLYTKQLNRRHQVSLPQLLCLKALCMEGPMPISKIGENLLVKSSTITGVIDRLEKKGLVERSRIGTDRRVITIRLTGSGSEMAADRMPSIHRNITHGLRNLAASEIQHIADSLNILVAMLEEPDIVEDQH